MSNYILECNQLSKVYRDAGAKIEVLKNINLQIKPSELIAIVGSSGSGKSTLLHLLGGLDKPTKGMVKIADKNLADLSENQKCQLRNSHLGFVYQFHHLLPEFTAVENVAMPLLIRSTEPKIAQTKAEHLLELVGLKERLLHKIGELSGGERQRVAIARALVTDPLCVLADEPTGNLDPKNAEKVLELFFDLQDNFKTSVIIVTHDLAIAKRTQRTFALERGELVNV
jgi:lipoprotein-releasing system ATP-binding protein